MLLPHGNGFTQRKVLSRTHIASIVVLVILFWGLALWMQGTPILSRAYLQPFSLVVGAVSATMFIFNKWLWALPIFRVWFVKRPDLRGMWRVQIKSHWTDPKTDSKPELIEGYAAVRQTLTTLSIRLMTAESRSHLLAHSIKLESDGIYRLAGVYRNEPELDLRGHRSEMHHGSFLFEVHGSPPTAMEGEYWTDRLTRGTMQLSDRKRGLFDSFDAAKGAFDAT